MRHVTIQEKREDTAAIRGGPVQVPRDADDLRDRLTRFLLRCHGARSVKIESLQLLTGGASRQTWSFDAVIEAADGPRLELPLVLRSDLKPGASFMERELEHRLIETVANAGVAVPRTHLMGDDSLGAPFFLMERVEGETIPRRILREDSYAEARESMTAQLGSLLASIHSIPTDHPGLTGLPSVPRGHSPAKSEVSRFEEIYRSLTPDPHPVFELAFRWLHERMPALGTEEPPALVHGDFRLGNLMVGPEGVRAVLDWELAHIGDPLEDLGWLCIRSWRFGNDAHPVAGVGQREDLWKAYEAAGGRSVDPARARFWETFANLRWGIMCIVQARPVLDGQTASVELATIGRRVAETEWELLDLMEND